MSGAAATSRESDARARRLAQTCFERPLVIEAGAGTGKTTTLVARVVVWALALGWAKVERETELHSEDAVARRVLARVVAITFTEAATAQMAHAVGDALAAVAAGDVPLGVEEDLLPAPAVRVARARALLRSLDQLVVRTIHAFCRRLLAEHALEARLHPRFAVDADESRQDAIVRQVVEEALPELATGAAGRVLARSQKGPQDVAKALLQLVRDGVDPDDLTGDPLAPALLAELHADLAAACAAFRSAGGDVLSGASAAGVQAAAAAAILALEGALEAPLDRAGLGALAERAAEIRVEQVAKWSRGDIAKSATRRLDDEGAALVEAAKRLHPLLKDLAGLDPALLEAVWTVLGTLHARVEERLRTEGVETFSALLRDAQRLLAGHREVRDRVRAGIDQLLVDEFQDTDRTQCDILQALALDTARSPAPGLFVVGDPKQSIYGWRNADLAAYDAFKVRVRAEGGEVVSLTVSHRSAPPILAEVERLVEPVMRAEPRVQPAFEALVPSEARAADPGFDEMGLAPVEHWVTWDWDAEAAASVAPSVPAASRIEARALAADLLRLRRAGTAWNEIALLFRSGTDWEAYLEALREVGVPFAVEGDRSYYERREVLEAAAFLRLVLDPNDQMALVTWLRSPLVGAPDAALLPLWDERLPDGLRAAYGAGTAKKLAARVARAVSAIPQEVPGIERVAGWEQNLLAAAEALGHLRETFDREPADVFVEDLRTRLLLEATEGARYLGPYRTANLERFFRDLLASLSRGDGDPQAVIRTLREDVAARREHEEGRPREAIEDAVQILTIHKAKGLSFEHVYVLQCHKEHGRQEEERSQHEAGRLELNLLGARSLLWHRARAARARVEEAERVRTWYVALTRARRRLVVAGTWPGAGKKGKGYGVFLEARRGGAPALDEALAAGAAGGPHDEAHDGARFVFPALPGAWATPPGTEAASEARPPALERIVRDARRLARAREQAQARMARSFSEPVSAAAHEALRDAWRNRREGEVEPAPAAGGRLERDAALAAGTALHRALEVLDAAAAPEAAQEQMRAALEDELMQGLAPSAREAARARGLDLIGTFVAGPLYARLRAIAGGVIARELPVLLPPEAGADEGPIGFRAGAVDLVYRDPESGALVVADYKTDRIASPAELDEKVALYASQGAGYVRAVESALRLGATPRFELWFLDAGIVRSA